MKLIQLLFLPGVAFFLFIKYLLLYFRGNINLKSIKMRIGLSKMVQSKITIFTAYQQMAIKQGKLQNKTECLTRSPFYHFFLNLNFLDLCEKKIVTTLKNL